MSKTPRPANTAAPRPETAEREIGRMLQQRRLELRYDLKDISDYLRIKPLYLAALESGDHAQLPGVTYAAGFLRTYAAFLGFDAAAVLRQYEQASSKHKPRTDYTPRAVSREGLPGGLILLLALLLAALLYGGWYGISTRPAHQDNSVPPVPDRLAAPLPRETVPEQPPAPPHVEHGPGHKRS